MSEQSNLERIGIETRDSLIVKNIYNKNDGSKYQAGHTRAMSDQTTPIHGKGTGIFMDTYNGGGSLDINGNPEVVGSGRIKNVAINQYNKDIGYTAPNTDANIGQVVI